MEQYSFTGEVIETEDIPPPPNPNKYKKPWEMFGYGPAGETCQTCGNREHICYRDRHYNKCPEWIVSHSEATDLRLKWPACGKWLARKETT